MKRKLITSIVLVGLLLLTISTIAFANDANVFSLTADKTSYTNGDTVVVTLFNAGSYAGVEGVLEYDSDVLTYTGITFATSIQEWNTAYENVRVPADGKVRFSLVGDTDNGTTGNWASFSFIVNEGETANITSELTLSNLKTASTSAALNTATSEALEISIIRVNSEITDASITLDEGISVNYYATLTEGNEAAQMKFTMNENEVIVDADPNYVNGMERKFSFEKIAPQCMTDVIKAELILEENVLDTHESFTIRAYCDSLLGAEDRLGMSENKYSQMKTLVADLLEYGAKAQEYRGYKTSSLANAGIEGKSTFNLLADSYKTVAPENGENLRITAGGVWFGNVNKLYFKFKTTDIENTVVEVDGTTYDYASGRLEVFDENTYIFYSDAVSPLKFDAKIDVTFTCGVETATMSYSVWNYVYSKQNNTNKMADLVKTLYNYGTSATIYSQAE